MFFEACDIYNPVSSLEVIWRYLEWKSKTLVQHQSKSIQLRKKLSMFDLFQIFKLFPLCLCFQMLCFITFYPKTKIEQKLFS